MGSPKKKTTMKKLNRENAVRERQAQKRAKKTARRDVASEQRAAVDPSPPNT